MAVKLPPIPKAAVLALGSCAPAVEAASSVALNAPRIAFAKDARISVLPTEGTNLKDEPILDPDRLSWRHDDGHRRRGAHGPTDRKLRRHSFLRIRRIRVAAKDVAHLGGIECRFPQLRRHATWNRETAVVRLPRLI